MWRKGVILKLTEFGIKGKMLRWINDFLVDRKIRVKAEDPVLDFQKKENGSPQGVVLSSTLFNGHTKDSNESPHGYAWLRRAA